MSTACQGLRAEPGEFPGLGTARRLPLPDAKGRARDKGLIHKKRPLHDWTACFLLSAERVMFRAVSRGHVLMDLFLGEASARIGSDAVPVRIDGFLDRGSFLPILRRGPGRSGLGPRGHDPLVLFRCLPVGQWHGPGDPQPERALKVRPEFMLSCGPDLQASVPDETTRCRFRNALVKGGVSDALPTGVCRRIEGHGLKPKVAAAARPRTTIEAPQDRAEGDAPDAPALRSGADPEARWLKKGPPSTPGYEALARSDGEGLVDKVRTTPASRAEGPEFGTMTDGAKAQRVMADKACASRAALRGRMRDGIMRPPRASGKRFDRLIPRRRFRIGPCFGTMKRLFGTHARPAIAAIGHSLLEAASRISRNPPSHDPADRTAVHAQGTADRTACPGTAHHRKIRSSGRSL